MDLARDVDALDRSACLPGPGAAGPQRSGDSPRQVGVGQDEHRVLAAELDRHLLLARDAGAGDGSPDRGRAGEEDLVDGRLCERDANLRRRRG